MITSTAECSVVIFQWQGGKVDSSICQRDGFCCFVASNASMWPTLGCLLDGLVEACTIVSKLSGTKLNGGSALWKHCLQGLLRVFTQKHLFGTSKMRCWVQAVSAHSIHISAGTKKWTVGGILGHKLRPLYVSQNSCKSIEIERFPCWQYVICSHFFTIFNESSMEKCKLGFDRNRKIAGSLFGKDLSLPRVAEPT